MVRSGDTRAAKLERLECLVRANLALGSTQAIVNAGFQVMLVASCDNVGVARSADVAEQEMTSFT